MSQISWNEIKSRAFVYSNDWHHEPPVMVKAHNALDKAVDQCYHKEPITTESQRIAYLFELYERYTATLFTDEKPKKKKKP